METVTKLIKSHTACHLRIRARTSIPGLLALYKMHK